MAILLMIPYWFMGWIMVAAASVALAMYVNTVLSLVYLSRHRSWFLPLAFAGIAVVATLVAWLPLPIAGWIGDRTEYKGQLAILAGVVWPGLFLLQIIPRFIRDGMKHIVKDVQ